MDPNATLKELRELISKSKRTDAYEDEPDQYVPDIERIAELSEALDEWITKGGFFPAAWCEPHRSGPRR